MNLDLYVVDWSYVDNSQDVGVALALSDTTYSYIEIYPYVLFASKSQYTGCEYELLDFLRGLKSRQIKTTMLKLAVVNADHVYKICLDKLENIRNLGEIFNTPSIGEYTLEILDLFKDSIVSDN